MNKLLRILSIHLLLILSYSAYSQCGVGYTQAQLNWDRLDYYFNSGGGAPYQNYITDAMETSQRFAIGKNNLTIALSSNNMVNPSVAGPIYGSAENSVHTGDLAGYTGADVQYDPSANGQTITITFNAEVQNTSFALYDVDANARIDIDAYNTANVAQNVDVTLQALSILTTINDNSTDTYIIDLLTADLIGNNSNQASAVVTIPSSINRIVLTITTVGTDAVFWLSDMNACVTGSFPNNYNQTPDNRPLQGPAGNQPDYFIVTPDNNSAYMVDPATGNAWLLFTDAARTYINSFAYDPYNRYLYYISENVAVDANNRQLKRYNFNTGTISTVVADITATLGIPTTGSGVESAGAAFYDGALYLGIEGGRYDVSGTSNDRTRETIFWRIDFDASQNPTTAYQVFATDAYMNASSTNTSIHDFGDFIIKDGILYSFNTARNGSNYSQSQYLHFNMTTGTMNTFNNPTSAAWNGQAGMTWAEGLYYFRATGTGTSGIGFYDENGNNSAPVNITVVDGSGAWPGGAGDASENFRPQVDFGDAPSSYDPNPLSPAAHAQNSNLRLGTNFDKEWVTRGQTALANSDNYDDGIPFVTTFNPVTGQYLFQVSVYNNTGANATVAAWVDADADGIFEPSEGITVTVSSSASSQLVWLYWPSIPSSLPMGSYTYLRMRITPSSLGMTTSNATGYYSSGEVEDYRVIVNSYALSVQQFNFNAKLTDSRTVKIDWNATDETNLSSYTIEKSTNNTDWETVSFMAPNGTMSYESIDQNAKKGTSYYRLKMTDKDGRIRISNTKKVTNKIDEFSFSIAPNPASDKTFVYIVSEETLSVPTTIEVVNELGMVVHTEKFLVKEGTNPIPLPVSKLANGRYMLRVVHQSTSHSKSLIINR